MYEPRKDGKISVTYADCRLPENAKYLRIHGYAPENAEIVIYLDDVKGGEMRLNTRDYEKKAEPARNHMPRAVEDERRRRASWPLLWADIYIPLDMGGFGADASKDGHVIRIEAEGPFKYDWFMITDDLSEI